MTIKPILFVTILAIVVYYKGVHSMDIHPSKLISAYLSFNEKDLDKFNLNCHYLLYIYIERSLYTELNNIKNNWNIFDLKRIINYRIRLLRVYYNNNKSQIYDLGCHMWNFYKYLIDCNADPKNQEKKIKLYGAAHVLTEIIESKNLLSHISKTGVMSEEFRSSFKFCENTLYSISQPSMNMEILLHSIYSKNSTNIKNANLPIEFTYGHILLLINKDEFSKLISMDDRFFQKLFIYNVIQESSLNIIDVMTRILLRIEHSHMWIEEFDNFLQMNTSGYILTILRHMYNQFIDTMQMISSIIVEPMNTNPKEFIQKYEFYIQIFKTKMFDLCPEVLPDDFLKKTVENPKLEFNAIKFKRRLTNYDTDTKTHSILVSLSGYYNIIKMDQYNESDIKDFLETPDAKILLELMLWLIVLNNYATLMVNDYEFTNRNITDDDVKFQRNFTNDMLPLCPYLNYKFQ